MRRTYTPHPPHPPRHTTSGPEQPHSTRADDAGADVPQQPQPVPETLARCPASRPRTILRPRNLISRRRPGSKGIGTTVPHRRTAKFAHGTHAQGAACTISLDKREKEKARTEIDIDIELAPFHVHRKANRSA
ncbi:hypothetical protein DFH09DRAFT_1311100 [Mycena vulgaris]|nr:hypothetical protein DFH09DRAFT_1311100 [Mycena vulgaris]